MNMLLSIVPLLFHILLEELFMFSGCIYIFMIYVACITQLLTQQFLLKIKILLIFELYLLF